VVSRFKRVENTNYVLVLGKQMKFTLVAVQGSDITDGVKTLTLGKPDFSSPFPPFSSRIAHSASFIM
jgi:hypothetical protein